MTDIECKVQKLDLEEGDMLVLTIPQRLTLEQMERVRRSVSPILARKGINEGDVLIIDGGAGLTVLRKSERPNPVEVPAAN